MRKETKNWLQMVEYDIKTAKDYFEKTKEVIKWLKQDMRLKG